MMENMVMYKATLIHLTGIGLVITYVLLSWLEGNTDGGADERFET